MGKYIKTSNKKLAKFGAGSISVTPVRNCPGAPKGGCRFSGKCCYAISIRRRYPSVRLHHEAVEQLFREETFAEAITAELRKRHKPLQYIRFFASGGDFANQNMLDQCIDLARRNPDVTFYAYTKSLHLDFSQLPANMNITQSVGGKYDNLIDYAKPHAWVFDSRESLQAWDYANGTDDDRLAADGRVVNIGLVAHQ